VFRGMTTGWLLVSITMTANFAFAGDPTRPAYLNFASPASGRSIKHAMSLKPLQLDAILYSQQRKLAIINNQILRVGEGIAGAKIVEIESSQVTVVRRGKKQTLRIFNAPSIKTYATTPNAADTARKANQNSDTSEGAP